MNEKDEMDRLFREADFAADNEGLEERLRRRILGRISEICEERELEEGELSGLAAAGTDAERTKALRALWKIFQ